MHGLIGFKGAVLFICSRVCKYFVGRFHRDSSLFQGMRAKRLPFRITRKHTLQFKENVRQML